MPTATVNNGDIDYEDLGEGPCFASISGNSHAIETFGHQRPLCSPRFRCISYYGRDRGPGNGHEASDRMAGSRHRGPLAGLPAPLIALSSAIGATAGRRVAGPYRVHRCPKSENSIKSKNCIIENSPREKVR